MWLLSLSFTYFQICCEMSSIKNILGRNFSSSKSVERKSYTKWNIWNTELSKLSNLWNVWAVWSKTRNKWNQRTKSRWRVSTIIYPKQIFGDEIPLFHDKISQQIFWLRITSTQIVKFQKNISEKILENFPKIFFPNFTIWFEVIHGRNSSIFWIIGNRIWMHIFMVLPIICQVFSISRNFDGFYFDIFLGNWPIFIKWLTY